MRSSQFRKRTIAPVFFTGSKCEVAIPIRSVLLRDALRQASLEPEVCAIRYRQAPHILGAQVSLTGVILDRVDGTFLLALCKVRPRCDEKQPRQFEKMLESRGLKLLERDESDIRSEPLFSNTAEIWLHERYPVPLNDRLRISAALEDGPQSIVDIEDRARPNCDIFCAICSLACENLIEIHIRDAPLGLNTVVRSRRAADIRARPRCDYS
ncbi:hypothetical protein IVB30_20070 [Bradyrhizobium sp. 200]|uniref:hypothetical protein n=1 Tax=Bradyrhizobium sp. 200 TaxID=2782665 RepID=UPI001FFF47CA|nr:hypothetical protein [Bradyrhizobium sp. 200]UPJ53405.1 hypothetical protein IVB30_20070 [Bradyrhizobium sp. 200]